MPPSLYCIIGYVSSVCLILFACGEVLRSCSVSVCLSVSEHAYINKSQLTTTAAVTPTRPSRCAARQVRSTGSMSSSVGRTCHVLRRRQVLSTPDRPLSLVSIAAVGGRTNNFLCPELGIKSRKEVVLFLEMY